MERLEFDIIKNPCIVYLRRSSKAKGQEDSIENQKTNILRFLRDNTNIKEEDLMFFIDNAKSGHKLLYDSPTSKKAKSPRIAFYEMLEFIKKLKNPCYLFVYDVSRLARNYEDIIKDVKQLLGLRVKNNKRLIEEIFFTLENKSWKYNTSETVIMNEVTSAVEKSEISRKYTNDTRIRALEKGEFPKTVRPPKGTELRNGVLCPTDKMLFIIKAFEMKANKFKDVDIRAFLKINGIIVSNRIKEVIFSNEIYMGFYTLPANKIKYKIKTFGNKPLIPLELFNKVNTGKNRGRNYGKLQAFDFISTILKTPCGKDFSAYVPGGKTQKQYLNSQTKSFISLKKLQKEYIKNEVFEKFLFFYSKVIIFNLLKASNNNKIHNFSLKEEFEKFLNLSFYEYKNIIESDSTSLNKIHIIFLIFYISDISYSFLGGDKIDKYSQDNIYNIENKGLNNVIHNYIFQYKDIIKEFLNNLKIFKMKISEMVYNFLMNEFSKNNPLILEINANSTEEIEKLNKELEKKQEDLKKLKLNATINGNFGEDYIQEAIKKFEKEILELQENLENLNIDKLNNNEILRFSEIVSKIIELLISSDYKAKKELSEEDFQEFIKLTTLELLFIRGSSLKIELFDVLEQGKNVIGVNE